MFKDYGIADDVVEETIIKTIKNPKAINQGTSGKFCYLSDIGGYTEMAVVVIVQPTVAVNGEIWTSYPFIVDGIVHEVTVKGIDEWMNELEAQIQCSLYEASVAFFDTKYFKNRDTYKQGEKYKFSLSAMAYSLSKTEPRIIEDKQGRELSTKGMAAFFSFQKGDVDDFFYSRSR